MEKELDTLYAELNACEDANAEGIIDDLRLKKKVARFCQTLMNEAGEDPHKIQDAANLIASFAQYVFEDDLDKVTDIAGELEFPGHYVKRDVPKMSGDMKVILAKYL